MKWYYGVDVGGTTVKLGRFSAQGELLEKWELPTNKAEGGRYLFSEIAASVRQHGREAGGEEIPAALGLGLPGPVQEDGFLEACVNIGLRQLYPAAEMGILLPGAEVVCLNDANAAALGEAWKGGGSGYRSMVLLTLGTGVGGGIIRDGRVLAGAHGLGGEVGHLPVYQEATEACSCGARGCLEQIASATGMVREARRLLEQGSQPSLLRGSELLTAKVVVDAAREGDALACRVMEQAAAALGTAMVCLSYTVDPEIFVFGGGVSRAGEYLLDQLRPAYEARLCLCHRSAELALAQLGNDAGIYGAAKAVLPHEKALAKTGVSL